MALRVNYGYDYASYEWGGLSEETLHAYSVELYRGETLVSGGYRGHDEITDFTRIFGSFTNLYEGTKYTIYVYIYDSDGNIYDYSFVHFTTKISVSKWSWNASNGSASVAKTYQFYRVLIGDASPDDGFSYLVWNDLVDKVSELLTATGRSWYSYQGYGKNRCKASIGETFSASKLNEVRYQIRDFVTGAMYDRVSGEEILGSYISNIASYINLAIDSINS